MVKILITGGAGFIGSNFVNFILEKYPDNKIIVLDKLTYAGRKENLRKTIDKITFVKGDICDKKLVEKLMINCDFVFNFAAETHVDRSIIEGGDFVKTDTFGTYILLETARKFEIKRFIQISTDEVYGSIENGSFDERDVLVPSSPYSASKGGGDLLVHSFFVTYGLPTIITRSSNNYGPYQHLEKFIPKLIVHAILNKKLPLYGDGKNVRDWLYVIDNCEAIDFISKNGKCGEIYNIGANEEKNNLEVANFILKILSKSQDLIKFTKDRPGHDKRYSLNCEKIKKLGWKPKNKFDFGLKKTIEWYEKNRWWWEPLLEKKYDFY